MPELTRLAKTGDLGSGTVNRAKAEIDVVDLFSGCGGLSTGFARIGDLVEGTYRLAAAFDINRWANATYETNLGLAPHPIELGSVMRDSALVDDIASKITRRGSYLVVVGGPPCQGFSAHNKRHQRARDSRNRLVEAFAAIASRLQPDMILMENVPEILAKRYWTDFLEFREILEAAGYMVRAQVHNVAEFGVPQQRFRALIIASRSPFLMPSGFLEPADFMTVREAIGHLPPVSAGDASPDDPMHQSANHRQSTIQTIKHVPRDGGSRPKGVGPASLDRVDGYRDVYGRLAWDKTSNTITAFARNPASGRFVHPEQHRGLTIREAALLQSFPPHFDFAGPFDDRFLQIGNAVPPAFAAAAAVHLLGELFADTPPPDDDTQSFEVTEPVTNSFSSGIAGRKRLK